MTDTYQIYLISDSTGETLDRIFLALKAQFLNIEYKVHLFLKDTESNFKILEDAEKNKINYLYTIVEYFLDIYQNKMSIHVWVLKQM